MLSPSGRGVYQISHCEKFDGGGAVLRTVTTRLWLPWRCGWGFHPLHPPQGYGGRAQCCYGGRVAHSRARFEIRWREGQPHYGRKLLRGTHSRATGTVAVPVLKGG